jgi:PTH1 family peptidyl-tRNA hydrolase
MRSLSPTTKEEQNLIEGAIAKSVRIILLACEGKIDIATMHLDTA